MSGTNGFLVQMIGPVLLLVGVIIWYAAKLRNRKKDVYGFDLPGWEVIQDDAVLYSIEVLFTQGLVSRALENSGYGISDWHSNLQQVSGASGGSGATAVSGAGATAVTGFIELRKNVSVTTFNPARKDGLPLDFGWATTDVQGFRYFWGKTNSSKTQLLLWRSTNLGQSLSEGMDSIAEELLELERSFGVNGWKIIAQGNDVVVLAPEIWDRGQLLRFLDVCGRIRAKLR